MGIVAGKGRKARPHEQTQRRDRRGLLRTMIAASMDCPGGRYDASQGDDVESSPQKDRAPQDGVPANTFKSPRYSRAQAGPA